ncbi:FAD dependent oxidoreductase [Naviculisporaceae sp. PSN 640]
MSQQDKKQQQKHVNVIGAGVIGLSSGLLLLEAGHAVTIIAEHFPAPFETIDPIEQINYSSPWAGAHNRFIPPLPSPPAGSESPSTPAQAQARREHALSIKTYHRMKTLSHSSSPSSEGEAGQFSSVRFMKGVELLENPGEEYLALTEERASSAELGIEQFRLLKPEEFPSDGNVKWGCEYQTWCLNPMVYCCFLLRRFVNRGGKILKRRLRSPQEAFYLNFPASLVGGGSLDVDAVVNASGNGFGDDPSMFITRGQTCVVSESGTENGQEPVTITRQNADGSWTFCIPRGADGGTVVGGTREPDNYDTTPCPVLREQLLERIVKTYPGLLPPGKSRLTPVRDIVGRRPTRRGGPRIEGEVVSLTGKGGSKKDGFVMHAYGMGGRGYELSWGVAEEVVKGVSQYLLDVEQKSSSKL